MEADITAIINIYKRPHTVKDQIDAILNQTIKPKNIYIWNNGNQSIDLSEYKQNPNIRVFDNNANYGVWSRFLIGFLASTEYICIFDDDTIPGPKWLENCYNTIQTHNGLLGTIGVKFITKTSYQPIQRYGWANPNEDVVEVDIVGHAWFFRREWLSTFWRELPDIDQSPIVGEDIHFSYTLKKYLGLSTYVPPHPANDKSMWGSMPELAWKIGQDSAAISMNHSNLDVMSQTYVNYIKKGFKS